MSCWQLSPVIEVHLKKVLHVLIPIPVHNFHELAEENKKKWQERTKVLFIGPFKKSMEHFCSFIRKKAKSPLASAEWPKKHRKDYANHKARIKA